MFVLYSKYLFPLYLNEHPLYKDLRTTLLMCYILFCSLSFIPLLIIKNSLAKNKIRGPLYARGRGGQGEMVPGPFQSTFLFLNPSLRDLILNTTMKGVKFKKWMIQARESLPNDPL